MAVCMFWWNENEYKVSVFAINHNEDQLELHIYSTIILKLVYVHNDVWL